MKDHNSAERLIFRQMMKKAIAIIMCVLISCVFFGCGEEAPASQPVSQTETVSAAEETAAEETEPPMLQRFADADFGGYEFRIACMEAAIGNTNRFMQEIYVESENGDVINDAVFKRNMAVEEALKIKIVPVAYAGGEVGQKVKKAVSAGDDAFDAVSNYKNETVGQLTAGIFRDWNQIPVWDKTMPWWNSGWCENLMINGKLYILSGNILISDIDDTLAMVFSKGLAEQYGIGDMYALVSGGKWTIDRLGEFANIVSADLDGDGVYDPEKDLYGYLGDPNSMTTNWLMAFDIDTGSVDGDGIYHVDVNVDKTTAALEKLARVFSGRKNAATDVELYTGLPWFKENRVLVYAIILRNVELLREMDVDFGIIPYPKYDESQTGYYTHAGLASPCLTVPATNVSDDVRTGTVIEAMGETSRALVLPAYYDMALKTKMSRDNESAAMLDIVLDGRKYTFSYYFGGGVEQIFRELAIKGSTDFSSKLEKKRSSIEKSYQKLIDKITDL